jgi:hypothetical protein
MFTLLLPAVACLAPQDSWTALPLPRLCQETSPSIQLPTLTAGAHIQLEGEREPSRPGTRAPLGPTDLISMLTEAAGSADASVEFFPFSPPLLARGTNEDLNWARKALAGIEAAGERNQLILSAYLLPTAGAGLPQDGEGLPTGAMTWRSEAWPGEWTSFGRRTRRDFVSSFDVEVSTDAGVASPRVSGVYHGNTVHLVASRVDGGEGYHLRGQLDLAELQAMESLDLDTPDLGEVEQPQVGTVTVAFSGSARSGELLRVEIEGAPLQQPNWTLLVRCETFAEPSGPAAAAPKPGHDWRAIDVTLLSGRGRSLPFLHPGAGLERQAGLDAMTSDAAPISASGVLSAVEVGSRGRRSTSLRASAPRTPLQVCEGLLLIAAGAGEDDLARRASEFVRAVSAPRLGTSEVELRSGPFRVRFPIAEGEPARVTAGTERILLVGYDAEIAPSTWMPSPVVERTFDGLAWQGRRTGERVVCSAWISESEGLEVLSRQQTGMGTVQLPQRSLRGAQRTFSHSRELVEVLAEPDGGRGLHVRVIGD